MFPKAIVLSVVMAALLSLSSGLVTINQAADLRDNATRHLDLATNHMKYGQYQQAIGEFQIAIRLNPHTAVTASLFNNMGICFQKTQQYPQAMSSFQHAIKLQPGFELYYKNLIDTYRQAGVLGTAQDKLRLILDQNPYDGEAWFLLALLHEENEDYEAAKLAFFKYLQLEPNSQLAVAARRHL